MGMLWQDNFEMMQASCLFLLWSTSPHWGFLPAIIINLVITKWWFATCIISSASISWNSTVRKSSCLFHLFTYLVIYLYQYDLVRIDFILWIISIITYLIFKVSQIWLQEPLQVGPCVLLTCPHFFFLAHPPFMAAQKYYRLILYFPYLVSESAISLKSSGFSYWRNQDLVILEYHCL